MGRIIVGYKPGTNPAGWGWTAAGTMRGTTFAGRAKPYWIVRLGGRVGRFTASTSTLRFAAYLANPTTWQPAALQVQTGTVSVAVLGNAATSNAGGANYELPVTAPILVEANQPLTVAALGTAASWWHGQDNSGQTMHERSGLSSPPNPFASTNSRPEGLMALWAIVWEANPPTIPTNTLSPAQNATTIDDTPTIGFDFRSTEEVLEGFALGAGDKLKKYQVQVWTENGSSKLHDSGILPASSGQQTARRATWTVPGALDPGRYRIRAQVWNLADQPSGWVTWYITVVGAGSIVLTGPSGLTNDATPDIDWSYTHREGLAMDRLIVRVTTPAGAIVRAEYDHDFGVDPTDPSDGTLAWSDTGWAALPPSDYLVQAKAVDTDSQPSPWSNALAVHVNAAPLAPASLQPAAGHVTTNPPQLSALITDSDDASSTLTVTFWIRKKSVGGSSTPLTGLFNPDNGRHFAESGPVLVPGGYDDYEWQVQATDPHDLAGPATAWRSLSYVAPPEITIVSPLEATNSSAPPFEWTIDRTQTAFRLRLFDDETGAPLASGDSGWINRVETNHTLPYLLLRNATTVRALLEVMTVGDIPGSIEWTFDVAYTPPATIADLTATPVAAWSDYADFPTAVRLAWTAAATDESDFDSYIIRARTVGATEWEEPPLALLSSVGATEFTVDNAPSGVAREYNVVQRVWEQLDLIESLPATAAASVTIAGVVLSVMIGGSGRVVLPYWRRRPQGPIRDRVVRKTWAPKPRITTGPGNHDRIQGTVRIFDDVTRNIQKEDFWAAILEIGETWIDAEGVLRDKVICYRDGLGKVGYYSMTSVTQDDGDSGRIGEVAIELVEISYPGVGS